MNSATTPRVSITTRPARSPQGAVGVRGKRFTAVNGEAVVRLLTPLTLTYPQAYDLTQPFDKVVREIANSVEGQAMVNDAVALIEVALEHHKVVNMVLINRAYGNAPDIGREIASRL